MANEAMGRVCPPSVARWLNSGARKLIHNPRRIMGPHVHPGDTVIDLGCGGGFFSVGLAELVGAQGRVIAVDLQQEMLEITRRLAAKKGVLDRISLRRCGADDLGLSGEQADFVLAFYMVHEVPDRRRFFAQVAGLLGAEARFMLVEPKHHVNPTQFEQMLAEAGAAGLKQVKPIKLMMSRGMLFSAR